MSTFIFVVLVLAVVAVAIIKITNFIANKHLALKEKVRAKMLAAAEEQVIAKGENFLSELEQWKSDRIKSARTKQTREAIGLLADSLERFSVLYNVHADLSPEGFYLSDDFFWYDDKNSYSLVLEAEALWEIDYDEDDEEETSPFLGSFEGCVTLTEEKINEKSGKDTTKVVTDLDQLSVSKFLNVLFKKWEPRLIKAREQQSIWEN